MTIRRKVIALQCPRTPGIRGGRRTISPARMLRLICWLMAPIGMFLPMFGSSFGGCSPFTTSLAKYPPTPLVPKTLSASFASDGGEA
jgi:hypothetical protein